MKKVKVAVIGSSSMAGSRFCELAKSDLDLTLADLRGGPSVDITDKNSLDAFFANYNFDWAILFSAFTDVDLAEKERGDKSGLCWQINVDGTRNVFDLCQKKHRNLIFISTDFVFDGTAGPYSETDPPGPDLNKVSWYGITKLEAEKILNDKTVRCFIIRISYPYRAKFRGKDDIARRILRLYDDGNLYPMFSDQQLTPTFIDDLAPAVNLLIRKKQTGIFHLASPKITTQLEFAKELISIFGKDPTVIREGSLKEFLKRPSATPRPIKGGLKVDKITNLGFEPTNWKNGIREIFAQSNGKLL